MKFLIKSRYGPILGTIAGILFGSLIVTIIDLFTYGHLFDEKIRPTFFKDISISVFMGGTFFYLLLSKIRELEIAREELQRIASTDNLTATLNRGAFTMLVEAWLKEARAIERPEQGALLIIDVDFFKKINDTYGHQTGDVALKRIAETIRANVRDKDLVGRVGGEEFGVFLPTVQMNTAMRIAERVREKVHDLSVRDDPGLERLSVSVGGVSFLSHVSYDQMFSIADHHLYKAKSSGRNRVEFSPNVEIKDISLPHPKT